MWRRRWGVALLVAMAGLIATVALLPPSSATFTSAVNVPATVAASAAFPGHPKLITDKAPVFYHRMEDAQGTAGSTAVDSINPPGTGVYGSATTGPSLWWRFDEATGATSFGDASGAVNTASINGTATAGGAGPMGGAVTLGAGASLSSLASPFRADRSFTVSVWFNIGTVVPTTTRIGVLSMTGSTSGTPNGAGTFPRSDAMIVAEPPAGCPAPSTTACWSFAMSQDPQNQAAPYDSVKTSNASPVTANTWVHLTAVFDQTAAMMWLYVNGTLSGSQPHTASPNAGSRAGLDVGRYRDVSWVGTTNGTAQIGGTRAWRRALPAADVTQLAVRPTARYAFNEATGSSTTYTASTASTGAPGTVSRSTGIATTGTAALAAGRDRNALTMTSAGGYLMGPDAQLATTGSFTIAAWVRLTDGTASRTFFSANYGLGNVVSFGYSSSKWSMSVLAGVMTETTTADTTPPVLNQWVHLVGAYDKNNGLIRLYVDGIAQPTNTVNAVVNADGPVVFGGTRALGMVTATWQGQVDDLRIYNGYPANATNAVTTGTLQTFVNYLTPGLSAEVPGGLQGTRTGHPGSTAVAFGGTGNAYNTKYAATPATAVFTVECLVRVGPGHSGVIAGFTNPGATTGLGATTSDRLLYVDSAGKVRFGVLQSGSPVTVVSAANVDDGAWHHITASVGSTNGGLKLSLDGTVSSNAAVTAATAASGAWRWGGAPLLPLVNWPSPPGNPYLTGTIDEFAVYDKQLTDQDDLYRVQAVL